MSVMVLSVRLLHQAALWDNAELLEDLLNGEELTFINSCDSWGRTPLHAASTTESSQCLRWEVGTVPTVLRIWIRFLRIRILEFFSNPDSGSRQKNTN